MAPAPQKGAAAHVSSTGERCKYGGMFAPPRHTNFSRPMPTQNTERTAGRSTDPYPTDTHVQTTVIRYTYMTLNKRKCGHGIILNVIITDTHFFSPMRHFYSGQKKKLKFLRDPKATAAEKKTTCCANLQDRVPFRTQSPAQNTNYATRPLPETTRSNTIPNSLLFSKRTKCPLQTETAGC